MNEPVIIGSVLAYAVLLFAIAWRADRPGRGGEQVDVWIYGLSIAVYCTSWTFYGAVGTARTSGWDYLPITLGPFLVFSIGRPLLARIVETGKRIHSTSIADFISAHYGKSRRIAALVTVIAVVGAMPYIALQLKSVSTTFAYLSTGESAGGAAGFNAIAIVAATLAAFAVMFGTRHIDVTRPNRGMVAAIAFDSIVKLAALAAVGLFALILSSQGGAIARTSEPVFGPVASPDRFITLTFLAMAAIVCLPRQFHVSVVECQKAAWLRPASLIFLAYLAMISVLVIPIANAGAAAGGLAGVPADLTVLALPLANGAAFLALIVFVGGFAAATGMAIVASVALSTMITNDLVAPFILQRDARAIAKGDFGRTLLAVRRASIVAVIGVAALVAAFAPAGEQLASLGILSFAAVAQFVPALIGALYWRRASAGGAFAGMLAGFALWFAALFAPAYFGAGAAALGAGFALAGVAGLDPLTQGVALCLGVNAALFVGLSLARPEGRFAGGTASDAGARAQPADDARVRAGDLYLLIRRCLGEKEAARIISQFEAGRGRGPDPRRIAGPALISFTDQQISKAIGASSASILLKSVLAGGALQLDEVATLLGETSGKVSFSQELLQTTLENISHGVSVVDADLNLVAWNAAYVALYAYPPDLIQEGRPIADLIRFNAARGECGPGEIEVHVEKRLAHLRAGKRHSAERTRPDGSVIRIEGVRSPSGAYVTTFTDVSEYKRIETALIDSERSIRFYTDNIPAMASFVDAQERIRFANSAYRRAFGLDEAEIESMTIAEALSADAYAARKPYIDKALGGEKATFDIELGENGARRHMQVTYAPEFRADGAVGGFFGVYQDVTERRRAQEELARTNETLEERVSARTRELSALNEALDAAREEAEKATASKTRFLAAASHDVLQPLNAARLFASALREAQTAKADDADPETIALTEKIDASIASADRLLRALLNISKLDAGGIRPDFSDFPLDAVFDELANDFAVTAAEKGVAYRTAPSGLWVRSDRGLLLSALQNIVANAVRYTDDGFVSISAAEIDDGVGIVVEDTGRGIPGARQREIFQEFRRLERDSDVSGAGLGLAMVERITRLLRVELHLHSQEGTGSRFSLILPRAAARAAAPAPAASAVPGALEGARALCIDNDAMVLDAMASALARWGAHVEAFASDVDYLAGEADAPIPDILLLDYQLDGERTGFDALEALEARWRRRPLTIMITASSSGEAEERAAAIGVPILAKPVEPAELRALIDQLRRRAAE